MLRNLVLAAALALTACSADVGQFCAEEYETACVQGAFDTLSACNTAGSIGAARACTPEFDAYLGCLDTSLDCGTCETLGLIYRECTADDSAVCNYYSRIDQGCFNDRPDCTAVLDDPRNAACFGEWRDLMRCFAESRPADGDCEDQCVDLAIIFFGC